MKEVRSRHHRFAVAVLAVFFALDGVFVPVADALALTQNAYRWRNDDGSEASATWAAAENASMTLTQNVAKRLRFGAANVADDEEYSLSQTTSLLLGEDNFSDAAVDTTNGFLYALGGTTPATVVKVQLSTFARVGSLSLTDGYMGSGGIAIDVAAGFLYVGSTTANFGSRIEKIRLSDFTLVGSLDITALVSGIADMAIDPAGGYLYASCSGSPAKALKIALSTFTVESSLTFNAGENSGYTVALDTANGFGYFGMTVLPGIIVKVQLSTFTRIGAVTFPSGQNYATTPIVDNVNGYLYVSNITNPGRIIRISLATFTIVDSLLLNSGENSIDKNAGFMDAAGQYAYYVTRDATPSQLVKIDLATFTRVGALTLATGETNSFLTFRDASGFAYVGTRTAPGILVKIDLATFTRVGAISYGTGGDNGAFKGIADSTNGFGYIATSTVPAKVVKIDLSSGTRLATLTLNSDESFAGTGFIHNGFLYVGLFGSPGKVVKIDLSSFTRVSALTLSSGNNNLRGGFVDPVSGFGYFSTLTSPGRVVKIDLASFTESATLALLAGEANLYGSIVDLANGFAYFSTFTSPAKLVKVDLSTFTRVGAVTFNAGENSALGAIAADLVHGYAYVGMFIDPGYIVKVDIDPSRAFARVGALVPSNARFLRDHGIADSEGRFAYFSGFDMTTGTQLATLFRVRLSDFSDAGRFLTTSTAPALMMDATESHLYAANGASPSRLFKISITPKPALRLEYGQKATTCAAIGAWTQVPATASGEHWEMAPSSGYADADATTNVAGGIADGAATFVAGRAKESGSEAAKVEVRNARFTEAEYSVRPTVNAAFGPTYCFRLTNAGTALLAYTNYAEATATPAPTSSSCSRPPTVTLATPNGGEVVRAGETRQVFWSADGCSISGITIRLSTDGGATHPTVVFSGAASGGSYAWTVPDDVAATGRARLKVSLLSFGQEVASDESDADFTIQGAAAVPTPEPPVAEPALTPESLGYVPATETEAAASIDDAMAIEPQAGTPACVPGSLMRIAADPAVSYCGKDGKRHVFLNERIFRTWFADFSQVMTVDPSVIAAIPEGAPVTYRPGVRMVKVPTDPKVYAVGSNGILRHVTSEAVAIALYGADWRLEVDDVPPEFFDDYVIGEPIGPPS